MSEEQNGQAAKQVLLQKIYVRDISLEVPNAPDIFTAEWQPKMEVELNTSVQNLSAEVHHVVLTVGITAKLGERTAYHAEVQQAGVVTLRGFSDDNERKAILGAYCPNLLFPFAREVVSELVQKGGFPAFLLQPVNFDALYQQHVEQTKTPKQAESGTEAASEIKH